MSFLSQIVDPTIRFQRKYAEHIINRFRWLAFPGAHVELECEWVEPRGLSAALARDPHVVVTGSLGAGKTTTLMYLALVSAKKLLSNPQARIPVLISAGDLQASTLPHFGDAVTAPNMSDELAAQCPRDFFAKALAAGRLLLLVDDVDALPVVQAQPWLREFTSAHIVASSQSVFPGLGEFSLPGFRDNDIEAYARKWNPANAQAFIAAIKMSAVPRALTANPMTLALLAHVWRADQSLPTRRTDLFERYALNALGDAGETVKMLEGVALAGQRGEPASNEFLSKSKGFLRAVKNHTAEFTHDLWQSYFAARALRATADLTPVTEHLAEPAWRDTILFFAGLGDANPLVDAVIASGDMPFAGQMIAHARAVRADVCDLVTQELIRRAWDGEDARAIAALAQMQSDEAVDKFAARLKEKDPAVRTHAAEILGQLQLDRGIEYLLPQLRDVNADVRDKVVEALGRSRTDRVIEPLLVALRGDPRVGTVDTRMRIAAAQALGEVASDKAVPALIVDLQVGEPEVQAAAANALKRISSPIVKKPLEGLAVSGDEEVRRYAADVLAVTRNGEV